MVMEVNNHFLIEVPGTGGELREGLIGLPHAINPVLAITDSDKDISSLVYSGLTKFENGKIVPDIATSWKISDDGLTYTFNLRNNVSFQDGVPLTADDIVYTINKIQDPAIKSPRSTDWTNVSVKEISLTQIQFILKQPYSPFITNTTLGIIPKHIWAGISNDQFVFSQYNTDPIGSGPYRVASITRDAHGIPTSYSLNTWSKYYKHIPYLSAITFIFYADGDNALTALDNGEIDSLAAVSPLQASLLAKDHAAAYTVLSAPLPRLFGVFFNQNQNPVLADQNVRTALNMSVDRATIISQALHGYGLPIDGPLPFGTNNSNVTSFNIAGAQALLEKNGWTKNADGIYMKKGKKDNTLLAFDIYTADTTDLKQVAEIVKNNWTKLGAEVNVKIFEPSDLYQNIIRTRKYDALLFGEFIGKDRDLFAFWNSSQRNYPGLNVAMYTNPNTDKILDSIRSASTEDVRANLFKQFSDTIKNDLPAAFLYVPDFTYVVPKNLKGVNLGTLTTSAERWNSVGNWYINTENVWEFFAKSSQN